MDSDDVPYMQVDFKKETVVTALASQGLNFPLGNWVKKYSLNYSCDGLNWQTYKSLDKNAVSTNTYNYSTATPFYPSGMFGISADNKVTLSGLCKYIFHCSFQLSV